MLAKDLVLDIVPPLKTSDTGLKALAWMDEFKVSHLPIVNDTEFLGLISDADILDLNAPEEAIGNHRLSLIRPFVDHEAHIFDVLHLVAEMHLTLVPIVENTNQYVGVITTQYLAEKLAEMLGADQPGGIIMLEIDEKDYTLAQIAQIVESNDAKILSSYAYKNPHGTDMLITLKINRGELNGILQTFYRYQYNVVASYQTDAFTEDIKQRYDLFMNYINM
jgi:acetoin utilization protein AcuB